LTHASANLSPLVRVLGAEDYEVDPNAEIAESLAESHELRSAALQLRLDDEQIQIALGAAFAAGTRAEQDHLGVGSGCGQATGSLRNEGLIGHERGR
jgi:hypothetical protein